MGNPVTATTPTRARPSAQRHQEITMDFLVSGGGTVYLLRPISTEAKAWVETHIPDDAQWLGEAVAVEHRYIADIVEGHPGRWPDRGVNHGQTIR